MCFLFLERVSRTASVIGMPTNITCTAGDILANCIPIVKDETSPRPKPVSPTSPHVTLTSRESLLDEIVKNAQGMGIDTLGLKTNDGTLIPTSARSSVASVNNSVKGKQSRPEAPPPQPPPSLTKNSSISRSEGDLLAANNNKTQVSAPVKEAMLEVEYTVLDNKKSPDSGVGISRQQSINMTSTPTSPTSPTATNAPLSRADSTIDRYD